MDDLFRSLELQSVKKTDMRDIVIEKLERIKSSSIDISISFTEEVEYISNFLQTGWEEEDRKISNGKNLEKIELWKEMAKRSRTKGLIYLTDNWYLFFRQQRSDFALICAMYEFSEIEKISPRKDEILNTEYQVQPIVLRLEAPKKQKSPEIKKSEIKFDVGAALMQSTIRIQDYFKGSRFQKRLDRFILRVSKKLKSNWDKKKVLKANEGIDDFVDRLVKESKFQIYLGLREIAKTWMKNVEKRQAKALYADLTILADEKEMAKRKRSKSVPRLKEIKIVSLKKPRKKQTKPKVYNIKNAFQTMCEPLISMIKEVELRIAEIEKPTKRLSFTRKVDQYKDAIRIRELLTVISQALSPRQSSLIQDE